MENLISKVKFINYLKSVIPDFFKELNSIGWRLIGVIILGSLCVLLSWSLNDEFCSRKFTDLLWGPYPERHTQFYQYINWFIDYFVFYVIIPLLFIIIFYKRKYKDFGLGWGNLNKYLPIYLLFLVVIIPIVIYASFSPEFIKQYPFMRLPILKFLIIWEILYAVQFIAIEFFFRGFLLFPLCEKMGSAGILVHVIPYCLIHITKPMPEAIGSIFTGILLGYFAWKSRSIWGGVILHVAVALTMDISSILQQYRI